MRLSRCILAIGLIGMSLGVTIFLFARAQGSGIKDPDGLAEDDEVDVAINGLWSAREIERESAKNRILRLGQKAIAPLVSLLEDVTNNPRPRFPSGREAEGMQAWERFQNTPFDKRDFHAMDKLRSLEITWRLYRDALDLLGQLRAEEAVPLLIRLMSTDGLVLSKKNSEMQALIEVGTAAVPKLIELIETPDEKLASDDYWLGPSHRGSEAPRAFRFVPRFIKSRAVIVLAKIGDSRALPALEGLLKTTNDHDLIESLQEAIRKLSGSSTRSNN